MQRVSVQLPDDLFADVSRAAEVERRSLSGEIVVRLRRALAGGSDGGNPHGAGQAVVALPASASANGDGLAGGDASTVSAHAASPPASSSRALPARPAARTAVCEHRIPASGFCKVCDGG